MSGRVVPQHAGVTELSGGKGVPVDDRVAVVSGSTEWTDDIEWADDGAPILGAPEDPEVCEVCQ